MSAADMRTPRTRCSQRRGCPLRASAGPRSALKYSPRFWRLVWELGPPGVAAGEVFPLPACW